MDMLNTITYLLYVLINQQMALIYKEKNKKINKLRNIKKYIHV